MELNSFRVLDNNINNNINNEITNETYENVMSLYSLMKINDDKKHMIRTNLRRNVQLKEAVLLKDLHGMKHICIWQNIRMHFINGFSDKCGIFDTPRRIRK